MTHDPIIEDIRQIRDEIARAHHYDINAIFAALREAEARSDKPHVSLEPRTTTPLARPAGNADRLTGSRGGL